MSLQLDNDGIVTISSNNQKVEMVEQYKQLGIIIDEHFEHNTQVRKNLKGCYSNLKI